MLDFKIIGGTLLDGTGAPAAAADVGVRGDRVEAVGDLSQAEAREILDARGKVVCPGFIDAHSHSDAFLLIRPSADSKIHQGITTEIVGNCGASAAPISGAYRMPSDWREKEYPGRWSTVAEYRQLIENDRPAVNVALLVGHGALRGGVVGYSKRAASDVELAKMADLLERALEDGAIGLSSGLIYPPGSFASHGEIVRLASVAARRGGVYTSHMRNEGRRLLESIKETLDVGRQTGIRVQISHLKTSGRENWALADRALDLIRRARSHEGLQAAADRYPYTSAHTDLDVVLPDWVTDGGHDAIMRRLRDPGDRRRIREDLLRSRTEEYWATVMIGSTYHPGNRRFRGMRMNDVAKALETGPVDAALHFFETDELRTGAFFFGMSEENMIKILREPYVMIGTDASVRAVDGPLSADYPHPRAYGTFPRYLRMCIDAGLLPLPEAVRKATSLPAAQFRLAGRGTIAEGMFADIVVFDPLAIRDRATYEEPHRLAEGVETAIVNGVMTLCGGLLTARRAGRFLSP